MSVEKQHSNESDGTCQLAISQEMNIYVIEELKDALNKETENYRHIDIDLSAVEEVDTAGIQLLLAFQNNLHKDDKLVKVTAMSEPVSTLVDIYAVTQRLTTGEFQ